MIAGSENVFARDLDQAPELSQCRALVVIGVTKAQINGVALIMKLGLLPPCLLDELRYAVHFLFALRDQACRTFRLVNDARLRFFIHKVDHFRQHR